MNLRTIALLILLAGGSLLVFALTKAEIRLPFESTLAPAFHILGKPIKRVDRALTRVLPIDEVDEARYGEAIALRYESFNGGTEADQAYVQSLIETVAAGTQKGFRYRAFIVETRSPNAFALPGGVVVVTSGLLETLKSESELVAVLAHEVGHVELSHCIDAVRLEIAAKKIGAAPLGEIADFAMNLMMRHSYSKTQENEADEYAWAYIKSSSYAPTGLGRSFRRLRTYYDPNRSDNETQRAPHPVSEYFQSHPHLEFRVDKYLERAKAWRKAHPDEERCVGTSLLVARTPLNTVTHDPSQWSTED